MFIKKPVRLELDGLFDLGYCRCGCLLLKRTVRGGYFYFGFSVTFGGANAPTLRRCFRASHVTHFVQKYFQFYLSNLQNAYNVLFVLRSLLFPQEQILHLPYSPHTPELMRLSFLMEQLCYQCLLFLDCYHSWQLFPLIVQFAFLRLHIPLSVFQGWLIIVPQIRAIEYME